MHAQRLRISAGSYMPLDVVSNTIAEKQREWSNKFVCLGLDETSQLNFLLLAPWVTVSAARSHAHHRVFKSRRSSCPSKLAERERSHVATYSSIVAGDEFGLSVEAVCVVVVLSSQYAQERVGNRLEGVRKFQYPQTREHFHRRNNCLEYVGDFRTGLVI